jgi:heptose-I-phosphate ethanolaminephosphotransferase
VTVIGEAADHVAFVSDRIGDDFEAAPDEQLLSVFREALQADIGPKVIFLHLMGTHWPYDRRYPSDFARFTGPLPAAAFGAWQRRHWILDYDNANLYIDHLIYRMIEMVKEHAPRASLLYFSDHGESVLEGTGHDSAMFSRSHVEIPFLFWFSDEFKDAHQDMIATLAANRHKRFMTDTLEATLFDLVGIETRYLEPEKSLFRTTFIEQDRKTLDGELDYDRHDDPLLNAKRNMQMISMERPSFYPKVWAHRANSLGKLSEVIGIFPGAELDLVFDEATKRLEVRHPHPPPAIDVDLDLEEVLDFLKGRGAETHLWLDLKNLEEDNLDGVLARLSELDQRYDLKDRVIVETTYTGSGFDQFFEQGFYTSYYLPTEEILSALETDDADQLRQLATQMSNVVRRHRARAMSFDIRLYDFVKEYLESLAAMNDLDYLTWDLSVNSSTIGFAQQIYERDLDERIKIILVPFSSRFDI